MAKWVGAALLASVVVVWAMSGWRAAHARVTSECWFEVSRGEATLSYWRHDPAASFRCSLKQDVISEILKGVFDESRAAWWQRGKWNWSLPHAWCRRGPGDTNAGAVLPLWTLTVIVALPSAHLFHRDRRSVRWAREGRCVGCGYDLLGVSGKCPECGKEAA